MDNQVSEDTKVKASLPSLSECEAPLKGTNINIINISTVRNPVRQVVNILNFLTMEHSLLLCTAVVGVCVSLKVV